MLRRPLTLLRRTIDPRLIELGRTGQGLNGHIPITAINSVLLALYAYAIGRGQVVFANERAASAPTVHLENGSSVNHQHSKSIGYERMLRAVFQAIPGLGVDYYSILRPTSELWTIRHLVQQCPDALDVFASCNRNFVFGGPNALKDDQNWCLACPKCVYTAVLLATTMEPVDLTRVMGGNPLADLANKKHLEELCGIASVKPWECVGEIEEISAAMGALYKSSDWAAVPLLAAIETPFRIRWPDDAALTARYESSYDLAGDHFIPDAVLRVMSAPN